jgi:hypothetical protein
MHRLGGHRLRFDPDSPLQQSACFYQSSGSAGRFFLEFDIDMHIVYRTRFSRLVFLDIAHQKTGFPAAGEQDIGVPFRDGDLRHDIATGKIAGAVGGHDQQPIESIGFHRF